MFACVCHEEGREEEWTPQGTFTIDAVCVCLCVCVSLK